MRAVVQLVSEASVSVGGKTVSKIGEGLVILLGVCDDDTEKDVKYLVDKIIHLRIFQDDKGLMNRSVQDINGSLLVVSQFTLFGDCRKGRRPSYSKAAPLERANELYELFIEEVKKKNIPVGAGVFQAMMQVKLINNGPVTILLDSQKTF